MQKLGTELQPRPRPLRRVRRPRRRRARRHQAARLLDKTLEDFRRARRRPDDATRARIKEINERLTARRPGVQQEHPRRRPHRPGRARAARRACPRTGSTRTRPTTTASSRVTTDYPDAIPVRMFVHGPRRRAARCGARSSTAAGRPTSRCSRELFELRAGARPPRRLRRLGRLRRRREDDRARARRSRSSSTGSPTPRRSPGERDREVLLERLRQDDPDATRSTASTAPTTRSWSARSSYDVDAQLVRTYFDFAAVRAGCST